MILGLKKYGNDQNSDQNDQNCNRITYQVDGHVFFVFSQKEFNRIHHGVWQFIVFLKHLLWEYLLRNCFRTAKPLQGVFLEKRGCA